MFNFFKKKSDIELCDNEFDIERIDVYAIERTFYGMTVFSYYTADGSDIEFSMLTTVKQHNDYVARLQTKLENKNANQIS